MVFLFVPIFVSIFKMISPSCFDWNEEMFRCSLFDEPSIVTMRAWGLNLTSVRTQRPSDVEFRSNCWYVSTTLNNGQKLYLAAIHVHAQAHHTRTLFIRNDSFLYELFTFIVTISGIRTKKDEQVMCNKMPLFTCTRKKKVNSWQIKYRVYEVNVSPGERRTKPSVNELEQKVNTSTWNAIRKCTKRQRAK